MLYNYHTIQYWLDQPDCTKIDIDHKEYDVVSIDHFTLDSSVMESVVVTLNDNQILVITRYGLITNRYLYKLVDMFTDRVHNTLVEPHVFDTNDYDYDVDITYADIKYADDIIEENVSIDNMIFDKSYETYGTFKDVQTIMAEYLCDNETLVNNHILYLESGNLFGERGGKIEKYRGREVLIDHLVQDSFITVTNV
jgi:hypothetical protein